MQATMSEQERAEMAEMFGDDWEATAAEYGSIACRACGTSELVQLDGSNRWLCPDCLIHDR